MSLRKLCLTAMFAACLMSVASGLTSTAEAKSTGRPLKGSFSGSGFTFGGNLSHLGKFAGQITSFTPTPTGGDTTATWAAANGDTVNVASDFTITGFDAATGLYTFSQAITILGGTGRFAHATGSATALGETAADFSTYHGDIDGTIGY